MSYSMFDPNMTTMAFETGKTLALTDPNSDNSKPENWRAEQRYGSPGAANQTGVHDMQSSLVEIYSLGHTIYVKNAAQSDVKVYDSLGQLVAYMNSCQQEEQFTVDQIGVYLVKVGTIARMVVVK